MDREETCEIVDSGEALNRDIQSEVQPFSALLQAGKEAQLYLAQCVVLPREQDKSRWGRKVKGLDFF